MGRLQSLGPNVNDHLNSIYEILSSSPSSVCQLESLAVALQTNEWGEIPDKFKSLLVIAIPPHPSDPWKAYHMMVKCKLELEAKENYQKRTLSVVFGSSGHWEACGSGHLHIQAPYLQSGAVLHRSTGNQVQASTSMPRVVVTARTTTRTMITPLMSRSLMAVEQPYKSSILNPVRI